ncbi:TPA: sigma-70 family RNA polymerase sigma factor [Listeria monocytogenes]|nr:sigma-70 family RNA polymerase sigma factor [Listeria monocytogenes]HAJ9305420.1 sigma-70 family RNA polymerase sigma factor [Listeria monocytogenes]
MAHKKTREKYILPVNGKLITVSREVYESFYTHERRERYLEERDRDKGLLYFSNYDTKDGNFVDSTEDKKVNVEKVVETGMIIKELYKALEGLNPEERDLITQIFFEERSIRDIAREKKISHVAIQKRRNKILEKLKYVLKDLED